MTPRNTKEGSGEIEAANLRLAPVTKAEAMSSRTVRLAEEFVRSAEESVATAKDLVEAKKKELEAAERQLKTAESKFETARVAAETARKDHVSIRADVIDAQAGVKASCEKWEVIEVESDSEGEVVSSEDDQDEDDEFPDKVIVEGCGIPSVNGFYSTGYNIIIGQFWKFHIDTMVEDSFVIYKEGDNTWYICCMNGGVLKKLYMAYGKSDSVPPENGWEILDGIEPSPKIRVLRSSV